MAEVRNRAVFDWLLNQVRTQPVFDGSAYDVAEPDAPDPDLPGLTEGQVGTALSDLIERYFVEGEPRLVMGRREPRFYDNLYPSAVGLAEFEDVERLLEEALPLLEAFVEPVDGISLPRDTTPAEIAGGVVRTSAEAYFEMRLLEAYELLSFERLNETGGHATFMNVRATARGRQVLYQIATGP